MKIEEIEIIRKALDTEETHKDFVKHITEAKIILNKMEEAINFTDSSLLLNNSFEIGNPVIYEREIFIIRFVDLSSELLDIESIDKSRYKGFIPLSKLTKIVL